jgi:ABC-type nitrate/sulfonate/bicarbonate transport systems, periplasmic components
MKKALVIALTVLMSFALFANGQSEAASAAKLQTLNIAYMPNYASMWSVVAADRLGYFEEEGFKVNLVQFADGPTEIAAMESGSIDVSYIGPGAHKLCINGRAKVFLFSQIGTADEVIVRPSRGIKTAADLKGKTVGYASGTSSEMVLRMALEEVGLTMNDIKAMEMDASGLVSAMTSGSLDACATWSPSTAIIKDALGSDAVMLCNNADFADKSASVASWICLEGYAEKNRDTLVKITRALIKGMDYASTHAEEVAKWVSEIIAVDYDTVYAQRFDGSWPTNTELKAMLSDGSMEKMYATQKAGFGEQVNQNAKISDYVMFDIMNEALNK